MSPAWVLCRDARDRAGLSQRALAERAGVSPSTVARIEKARIEPTLDLLLRLISACGLDLRMRLAPRVYEDEPIPVTDIDRRLEELEELSAFALDARRTGLMPEPWTAELSVFRPRQILRALDEHGVRYVLVGGLAAIAYGWSGATFDADIVPDREDDNLLRLAAALRALAARLYANPVRSDLAPDGAPPEAADLDLSDPASLRRHLAWFFNTAAGRLDVLLVIDGPGGFEPLARQAVTRQIAGVDVLVASYADLIESKQTAGRDKDLAVVAELRRLHGGDRRQTS